MSYKITITSDDPAVFFCEEQYPEMCSAFTKYLAEEYILLCQKQMDYGPGNIAMGTTLSTNKEVKLSLTGIIIRLNDKIQRLINLVITNDREPTNESLVDTLKDIANYANIALVVLSGKWAR